MFYFNIYLWPVKVVDNKKAPKVPLTEDEAVLALFSSCFSNDLEEMKNTISKCNHLKLDFNKIHDSNDNSLLHIASFYGYFDILKYLINSLKMDINICDRYGHTALHWASMEENINCMEYLLGNNNNNNNNNNNEYGMMNVNAVNKDGLFVVIRQIPVYLVGGKTCLHLSAEFGCIKSIQLLLKNSKIDVTIKDNNGYTAYDLALMNKRFECAKLLKNNENNNNNNNNNIKNNNWGEMDKTELYNVFCDDIIKTQKRISEMILQSKLPGMHGNCCSTCRKLYKVAGQDPNDQPQESGENKATDSGKQKRKIILVPTGPM